MSGGMGSREPETRAHREAGAHLAGFPLRARFRTGPRKREEADDEAPAAHRPRTLPAGRSSGGGGRPGDQGPGGGDHRRHLRATGRVRSDAHPAGAQHRGGLRPGAGPAPADHPHHRRRGARHAGRGGRGAAGPQPDPGAGPRADRRGLARQRRRPGRTTPRAAAGRGHRLDHGLAPRPGVQPRRRRPGGRRLPDRPCPGTRPQAPALGTALSLASGSPGGSGASSGARS